ncbi:MAG: ribosomal L7Ae/L30e/S12e/Gadd45 family protein [Nanoarchaeota archaeon]|nr:ribosomal L7Ae/L30e/S12e/Gadd45 family protein [Nanoarchaeota archaeon]
MDLQDSYQESVTPSNELKGFTKSFVKRTKDKKQEDGAIKELLSFQRELRLHCGSKVAEKALKNAKAVKVFFASNCDELTQQKLSYYAQLNGIEVEQVAIDNNELGRKLSKPFAVSTVWVSKEVQ